MIICADDFGSTTGVNDAVLELFDCGVLTHAAMMSKGPASYDAAQIAKKNPRLVVGLHLVLTDEVYQRDDSTIVANSTFYSRNRLLYKLITNQVAPMDVYREISKQYHELLDLGINVSFINGHQHVHALPKISNILTKFASEVGLPVRNPMEKFAVSLNPKQNLKKLLAFFMYKHLLKCCRKYNVKTNQLLISNFAGDKRDFTLDGFRELFNRNLVNGKLPANTELMVHPAASDCGLDDFWYYDKNHVRERIIEFDTLRSDEFKNLLSLIS